MTRANTTPRTPNKQNITNQIINYYLRDEIDKTIHEVNLLETVPNVLINELILMISRDPESQKKNILLSLLLTSIKKNKISSTETSIAVALEVAARNGNLLYIKTIVSYLEEVSHLDNYDFLKNPLVVAAVNDNFDIVTYLGPFIIKWSKNISNTIRSILNDFDRRYRFESFNHTLRPVEELKRTLVIYLFEELHIINQGIKVLTESKLPRDLFQIFSDFLI